MIMTRIFPLLLLLMFFAGVANAADRIPPQARQVLHKAQMCMDDSQLADAVTVLHEYMAQTDETIPLQVYLMLGGVHHKDGAKEKALKAFRDGLKAYPESELLARNSAVTCYELERYAEAGQLFEKAHSLLSPPKPVLLFQAGSAYYSGEDYTAAARVMSRLLSMEQAPKKEWVRLAVHSHLEAGQFKKAESMLRKYLSKNPNEAPYWELLAKLHLDREEYEKAASALEICYRLRPSSPKELERLASLYSYSNAPLMASATLKRAYPGVADADKSMKIALLSASAGRSEEAIQQLSRLGDSASVAERKGHILYQARRFTEAEKVFERVVQRNEKSGDSLYFLAMCAWEKRDWNTAKSFLKRLSGNKKFSRRVIPPLAVIDDLEVARKEAFN